MNTIGWAVLVVGCVGSPSWASASDKSGQDEAKVLVRAGLAQFGEREYPEAAETFARAYALDPTPGTLLDLAISELNADRPVEAAAHFRVYLTSAGEPPAKLESVRSKYLPRAEEKLARLQLVVPAGADVVVDGQPATPDAALGQVEVVAGEHDVEVRASGRTERTHVTAPVGSTVQMRLLVDAPPPAAPEPSPSLPPSPPPEPDRGASAARIGTTVGLGVAALAGLGVGIGFGAAAQEKASAISGGEGCISSMPTSLACQHLNYDVSVQHDAEWASIGGYVGAGVFAAAGVATWLFWPTSEVHVSGSLGPREVALTVRGALP